MKKWNGTQPVICDTCNQYPVEWFVDGVVRNSGGSWALMCQTCFPRFGRGLGVGLGQMYDAKTLEKFSE